jgi:ribosomal protein L11 methyltransferase
MKNQKEIWALRFFTPPEYEYLYEEAFMDMCAASSSLIEPDNRILLEFLFTEKPSSKDIQRTINDVALPNSIPIPSFEIVSLGNLDWIKEVSGNFSPISIGRWTIYGSAFHKEIKDRTLALQIDATSAFGTGEHPTTRGCLVLLDELLTGNKESCNWNMLDMGCGSGILAMAFTKACPKGQALGIDIDEDSIEIARNNASINNVGEHVLIEHGEGYSNPVVTHNGPYDLIMANVFAQPLCEMAPDLKRHLKDGGHAILSGILNDQAETVLLAHKQQGLIVTDQRRFGEWSVLAFTSPVDAS